MTLPLTPDTLRAAYEYLRSTPPFNRWKMPQGDQIEMRVAAHQTWTGWHERKADGQDVIAISHRLVGHTQTLLKTMAHEMCHVRQAQLGRKDVHGKFFKSLIKQVCRHHGFDPKEL